MSLEEKKISMSPLQLLLKHAPNFMIIKPLCPYCDMARRLLKEEGIEYKEYAFKEVPDVDNEISYTYGHKTYPKIFIKNELIGGYDRLSGIYRKREL